MNYSEAVRDAVRNLPVYQPGKPIELVARQHGLDPAQVIKLASNENPLGAPPEALAVIRARASESWLYPDNSAHALVGALCERNGWAAENLVITAGSNEVFYLLCQLFGGPEVEVIVGEYAFVSYEIAAQLSGARVVKVPMPDYRHDLAAMAAAITERTRLIFLANPNNPTGTRLGVAEVAAFARALPPHVVLCYDGAYAEYETERLDVMALVAEGVAIIGTQTFSKIYGLAGLRIGYGYGDPELIGLLNRIRPPFNTGILAQHAALAALQADAWVARCVAENAQGLVRLQRGVEALGLNWVGGAGNFLLVEHPASGQLCDQLMKNGIIVRSMAGYGLAGYHRVSVGTPSQVDGYLGAMARLLAEPA